ncbi:MAG: hypothetical protein JWR84_726 [Caulobacter sp.]|nr:hypothetical protein [Caulobacter sp.]
MRLGLVLLLIGLPGAALAAEDRYGPSRSHIPVAAVIPVSATAAPVLREPTDYRGRTLTWSGKPFAAAPQGPPAAPPQAAPAPPPQVFASRSPEPARLPTSLYDAPALAPAPPAPAIATPPAYSPPPAPAQPQAAVWPQAVQPSLPPPPSPPPLAGSPSYGYSPPRSYSVVREWGGTPDRIPTPPAAAQFSGREVALDPNTLGAAQQPDSPAEDEVDEEQAQQQRDQQKQNLAKGSRK